MSQGDGFIKRKKNPSMKNGSHSANPYHFGGLKKVKIDASFPLGASVLTLTGISLFTGETALAIT
jgi:hypothetical protein